MKKKYSYLFGSCIILMASICFFSIGRKQYSSPVPEPSVYGGYYQDAFTLHLSAPSNGKIYYTTDGSTPTSDSTIYKDGIIIVDRSSEQNLYTSIQNCRKDWKTYTPDQTPVEKGTVVRAVFVNDWGIESEILTQTYFVGIQPPEQGYTLSLVFEYDDLFGDNGIYVTGAEYDAWYLSDNPSSEAPIPNFEKDLEVKVTAELQDSSGDVMNQPIGLRLQGASARNEYKKRFTLVSREEYSGSNVFDAMLYEGVTTHSIMLKQALPDAIVADLIADRAVAVQRSIPVRVFLNGEFWYDSYMLERYDSQYFNQHYQIDNYVLVKNGFVKEARNLNKEQYHYDDYMYRVEHTDYSDNSNWAAIQEETDIQSYIDYISTNYFLCNSDFGDWHNYVLWHEPFQGGQKTDSSRWKWCIYDIDVLEWIDDHPWIDSHPEYIEPDKINIFSSEDTLDINDSTLFRALRSNAEFCQQFVISFMDMLNNNFAPSNVERVLQKYGYTLDWKNGYFRNRPTYAVEHLVEEFDLTGSLETVTVTTTHPEMGNININTSQIDLSSGTWSGQYFTDYPITVTAMPKDGYTFIGWKGASGETEPTITLSMDNGPVLEAVFAKTK